jgi:hypothetical protein
MAVTAYKLEFPHRHSYEFHPTITMPVTLISDINTQVRAVDLSGALRIAAPESLNRLTLLLANSIFPLPASP